MCLGHLGYAVTVHTAQGLTLDTTHGALTGTEFRQQLYVMMTRGRLANHVYVPVVGDGDEHAVLHPSSLLPETAVDVLESILSRDGAARSATTENREATAPASRLADAAAQYLDGLHVAAETMLHPDVIQALDQGANEVVEGLTDCAAWLTLRSILFLNAIDGRHPLDELRTAALTWELDSARDPAAVLTWRISHPAGIGPLPWLPPVPDTLRDEPKGSRYLSICAGAVRRSTRELQQEFQNPGRPVWALPGQQLTSALIGEVEVWRAAVGVDLSDRRATGRVQLGAAARAWQQQLDDQLQPGVALWTDALAHLHPEIRNDPYTATLAHRVAALHNDRLNITKMLVSVAAEGLLPAEHTAAAVWLRLWRHLSQNDHADILRPPFIRLTSERPLVDEVRAREANSGPWCSNLGRDINQRRPSSDEIFDLVPRPEERSEFKQDGQTAKKKEPYIEETEPVDASKPDPHRSVPSRPIRLDRMRVEKLRRKRPSGPAR
ncbi:MAG: C-terminal helicase domain-containing protein [Arachnia sp.]